MKAIRRPLFWFNLVMWIVSGFIAAFLIQLGSLVLSDLPKVGAPLERADFVDQAALTEIDARILSLQTQLEAEANAIEDATFVLESRRLDYATQKSIFDAWVKTRTATGETAQNDEVTESVAIIEALRVAQRDAERALEDARRENRSTQDALAQARIDRQDVVAAAHAPFKRAEAFEELKVFGLRLALTLPLLVLAGWFILRKRTDSYWPIYRGFVLFALFAFFVELVPYLPSYGGYVRSLVGIALALLAARFLTQRMARYLQRKTEEEARPEAEKRKDIPYEDAIKKITSGTCPSCDRQFVLENTRKPVAVAEMGVDYCMHCGFNLYRNCGACGARNNSFFKFCGSCGTSMAMPAE